MPKEIERKFLVSGNWRGDADAGREFIQAYLAETGSAVVRVRLVDGVEAFLTIKSAAPGLARDEFEYPLPLADAQALIALRQGSMLAKTRFRVTHAGRLWEVDVYLGENQGLVLAEIELARETDSVDLPPWLGREVTGEARYYASRLSREPFSTWPDRAAEPGGGT